jgi:hypothetical protein
MSFDFGVWDKTWYAAASAEQRTEFRDWLSDSLKHQQAVVQFIKHDQTLRDLQCTLQPDLIPVRMVLPESIQRMQNRRTETLSVWDLENAAWRSFRLDSIQSISFNPAE